MRVAAYCRVSTDANEQLESLENQKTFFGDFAEKNNYKLVKIYADEGISGKQVKNRAEFLRMLEDAKYNIFDMVIVKDISRFARNTVDFLNSVRNLKSLGIEVKFLSNNQTILGDSEFVLTIFSAMAQEESANLSKRVKFGKKVNAKKGRVPARVYGYKRVDNFTLIPDEEESEIINRIFDMYVNQGIGASGIAKKLSLNKIPSKITKSPSSWNSKTIRRILCNPIYIGRHINNKYEIKDYLTGERGILPESEHIHHDRPDFKIISDEIYNAAQNRLTRNRDLYKNKYTHTQGRESSRHIFSTLIKCANCGLSFSRKSYTYKKTRTFWICPGFNNRGAHFCDNRTTIEEQDMLDNLKIQLTEVINNKSDFIQDIITDYNKNISQNQSEYDFNKIEKQILKLESEKEKYKSMYLNEVIGMEELKLSVNNIEEKINEYKNKVYEYERICKMKDNIESNSKQLIYEIENLLNMENWDSIALKRLIDYITVNKNGEVHTVFKGIN